MSSLSQPSSPAYFPSHPPPHNLYYPKWRIQQLRNWTHFFFGGGGVHLLDMLVSLSNSRPIPYVHLQVCTSRSVYIYIDANSHPSHRLDRWGGVRGRSGGGGYAANHVCYTLLHRHYWSGREWRHLHDVLTYTFSLLRNVSGAVCLQVLYFAGFFSPGSDKIIQTCSVIYKNPEIWAIYTEICRVDAHLQHITEFHWTYHGGVGIFYS
jgi:predicted dehydrogenase